MNRTEFQGSHKTKQTQKKGMIQNTRVCFCTVWRVPAEIWRGERHATTRA